MSHDEEVVNLDSRLSESLNLTSETDEETVGAGQRNGYELLTANGNGLASMADNKKSTHPLGTLFLKNSTCHTHVMHSASVNGGETEALSEAGGRTMSEASTYLSQQSKSSQTESATTGAAQSSSTGSGIRHSTKVYYHIDEEPTPYCTEVRVSPDKITLGDFKRVLNRSNFKYHYKGIDPLLGGEVKNEILDDCHLLSECRSSNGQFELFLLTVEGSTHSNETSSGFSKHQQAGRYMVPGPAPSSYYPAPHHKLHHKQYFDSGHRHRAPAPPFEDSTIYTESEARLYSDDESRVSSSTERVTSVSQQHLYRRRNRRQHHRRQPSRASSMSSMTEMSMQLNVVTVTLNIDTVTFLGISIVGQTCTRGDNGIYVADVMPGGAVALDGRIEPGDMILQVNDISFENLSNDQAVDVLKQAMEKKGPLKLMVAKCFDGMKSNNFFAVAREPVRPIDTQAWVQHTNAVRGMGISSGMNSIPEGSEGAPTPIPGQYPTSVGGGPMNGPMMSMGMPQHSAVNYNSHHMLGLPGFSGTQVAPVGRPASSSTATSNGSGGGGGGGGTMMSQQGPSGGMFMVHPSANAQTQASISPLCLDVNTDKKTVLQAMALPNSGLDIHNRKWLKIVFPMSFLGSDLVHWLFDNVEGFRDRKEARKYASELLKQRFIEHVVNKTTFSEQCYYVFAKEYADFLKYRKGEGGGPPNQQQSQQSYHPLIHQQQLPPPHLLPQMMPPPGGGGQPQYLPSNSQGGMWIPGHQQQPQQHVARSLISEYASMPPVASPYPPGGYIPHNQPQSGRMMSGGGGMYVTAANVMLPGQYGQQQQQNFDHHSQANSNNSNDGGGTSSGGGSSSDQHHRRKAVLPPAPSLSSSIPAGGIPPPPSQQLGGMKLTNGGPPPPSSHFFSTQLHHPHRHGGGNAAGEGTTYAGEDFFLQHL